MLLFSLSTIAEHAGSVYKQCVLSIDYAALCSRHADILCNHYKVKLVLRKKFLCIPNNLGSIYLEHTEQIKIFYNSQKFRQHAHPLNLK